MRDMLGREEVIPVEEALDLIFRNLSPKIPPERKSKDRRIIWPNCIKRHLFDPEDLPEFRVHC